MLLTRLPGKNPFYLLKQSFLYCYVIRFSLIILTPGVMGPLSLIGSARSESEHYVHPAGYLIVRFASFIPCLVWHTRASRSHVIVKLQTCTRALLSPQHTSLVSSYFSLFFFISVSAVGPLMSPQGAHMLAPYINAPDSSRGMEKNWQCTSSKLLIHHLMCPSFFVLSTLSYPLN
jgi:hypothetical protein